MIRMWFIPHDREPYFKVESIYNVSTRYNECLSLSPVLSLLYNINKSSPNKTLSKYGYILSDIPGDAVMIDETGNIDFNIIEKLYDIVRRDHKARLEYISSFEE